MWQKISKRAKVISVIFGVLVLAVFVVVTWGIKSGKLAIKASTTQARIGGYVSSLFPCDKYGNMVSITNTSYYGDEIGGTWSDTTDDYGRYIIPNYENLNIKVGFYRVQDFGSNCGGKFTAFKRGFNVGRCEPADLRHDVRIVELTTANPVVDNENFKNTAFSTVPVYVEEVDRRCASSGGTNCKKAAHDAKVYTTYNQTQNDLFYWVGEDGLTYAEDTFGVLLPVGKWKITAVKQGFIDDSVDVEIKEGCAQQKPVTLELKSI